MASHFDESDFVDGDFQTAKVPPPAPSAASASHPRRPPTREELDGQVGETQQRLGELKRQQLELERERAALEEARRRRIEFQTGREEMLQHLSRGVGLLEEAEFAARRDAEQMAKTLAGLRDVLAKVQAIHEETWTQENWNLELTRALTAIENARMEWNGARLKWALLDGSISSADPRKEAAPSMLALLEGGNYRQLCKLGLALTWPIVLLGLVGLGIMLFRSPR
jgi:chromosome segregation ATPase